MEISVMQASNACIQSQYMSPSGAVELVPPLIMTIL